MFAGIALLFGALALLVCCGRFNRADPSTTAAVLALQPTASSVSGTLRLVTYNVHMESSAAIAKVISENSELASADVLLLQEIENREGELSTRAEQVAKALGMGVAYAPGYGLPNGGSHGVAILSRVALRDIEILELPRYHVVVNSARRVALAATVAIDGRDVRIFSVHLDNRINPQKRRRQLAPVFASAQNYAGPAVIAGDLNTSPFCWAGSLVPIPCGKQDNAVENAARWAGFDTPIKALGATSKWLGMRLDAIYTRGLVTRAGAVERSEGLSDHFPIWVDLQVR